jgi:hypothetical protein
LEKKKTAFETLKTKDRCRNEFLFQQSQFIDDVKKSQQTIDIEIFVLLILEFIKKNPVVLV